MTGTETIGAQVLVQTCELLFLSAAVWVWRELARMGVNGPCQIGLGLLVLLRLSAAVTSATHPGRVLDWAWLTGALFSFVFLYTLYQMGLLICAWRRQA